VRGADDDESGPDHEHCEFEQPTAITEETAKAFELGAECLDGRGQLGAQAGAGDGVGAFFHVAADEFPLITEFTAALALFTEQGHFHVGKACAAGVPDQAKSHSHAERVVFWVESRASRCSPWKCYDAAAIAWSMEVDLLCFSIETNE